MTDQTPSPQDTFNGDNAALVRNIAALLTMKNLTPPVPGLARELLASSAARLAAAPAPSSVAGGEVERQTIIDAVKVAMNDAWCDITSDTDCWPADLTRVSQRGPVRLEYRPAIWTDTTAEMAANAILAALSPEAPAGEGGWIARVMEVREERDGFWRACSGCQESEDGHVSESDYPYSATFGCQPGGGCGSCGGLGVVWDATDYDAMADAMLSDMEDEDAALTPRHEAPAEGAGEALTLAMIKDLEGCVSKASAGPWEDDTVRCDGEPNYDGYEIFDANGNPIFGSIFSDASNMEDEFWSNEDGDEYLAWDETAKRNAALIVQVWRCLPGLISCAKAALRRSSAPEVRDAS